MVRDPAGTPVAVPRVETPEEHARREIEEAMGRLGAEEAAGRKRGRSERRREP
jgi:hypothetical protein